MQAKEAGKVPKAEGDQHHSCMLFIFISLVSDVAPLFPAEPSISTVICPLHFTYGGDRSLRSIRFGLRIKT
jgi:hypothetical protein